MKKLLSLLIVASAVLPLHARSDFDMEMREHRREMREQREAAKKTLDSAKPQTAARLHADGDAPIVAERLKKTWRGMLIAIGEDSNDAGNYPDLLLHCGVLLSNDSVPSCGSADAKKAQDAESIKHHVLAHKTVDVLIAMHYKPDAKRLAAINEGIASLEGHQSRITEALASDGKKYRYAYDQSSMAGEGFQKDVKSTWEAAKEIAGILEALTPGGAGK